MERSEEVKRNAADLHWLAVLLTGRRETAAEVTFQALNPGNLANPLFSRRVQTWSRRNVIAKALTAVREDLARSARAMEARPVDQSEIPPQSWSLEQFTTKRDLEWALLRIDVFPRAAVLLLIFERVPLRDAALLLSVEPDLVRKALAVGARALTANLARKQGWKSAVCGTNSNSEGHHAQSAETAS